MRDTKGHQVGGNGDAKYSGETRAGQRGGATPLETPSWYSDWLNRTRQRAYVTIDRSSSNPDEGGHEVLLKNYLTKVKL